MAHKGKFYAYSRFSPRPNADECESCERQEEEIREWCNTHGFDFALAFKDVAMSGGLDEDHINLETIFEKRPGLAQALCACRRGDVLVVRSFDRLSRSIQLVSFVATELRTRGVELISITEATKDVTKDPAGTMMMHIRVAIAEYDRAMIRLRTKVGMRRNQANGRIQGFAAPYGMLEVEADETTLPDGSIVKRRKMSPDPIEQEIIERIKHMHSQGIGLRPICRMLMNQGVLFRGRPWNHLTVRNILRRTGGLAVPV